MWLRERPRAAGAGGGGGGLIFEMNRRSHISLPCRDLCALGPRRGCGPAPTATAAADAAAGSVFHKSVIVFPSSILLPAAAAPQARNFPLLLLSIFAPKVGRSVGGSRAAEIY